MKSIRKGINNSKILNFFFILNWSNRLKFVQNNASNNVFVDYSLHLSEMNESNDTREGREKLRMYFLV